jgi:cell division protein ZapA
MPRRRTTVRINGQEYVLAGEEPEEYMHEVAIYVDKKMSEISRKYDKLSTSMVAVLASINIADELLKERRKKVPRQKKEQTSTTQTKMDVKNETIARFNRTK